MKFTKETARRLLRTFMQAAFGYLSAFGISILANAEDNKRDAIIFVIGSMLAAGMAAVMNLEPSDESKKSIDKIQEEGEDYYE